MRIILPQTCKFHIYKPVDTLKERFYFSLHIDGEARFIVYAYKCSNLGTCTSMWLLHSQNNECV